MSTAVQRRRGTTAQHASFAGLNGELTIDTDKEVVVVHDGATAGGYPMMRENGSNSALALGSAATPSLKFTGDTNTGIYSPGADQVSVATGGTERLRIDNTGQIEAVSLGTAAAPVFSFTGDTNTGIYSPGADQVAISTGGSGRLFVDASGNVGVGAAPSTRLETYVASGGNTLRLTNASNTGSDTCSLQFVQGGAQRAVLYTSSNILYLAGDATTVLSAGSTSPLVFNAGGSERLRITSAGDIGVGTSAPASNSITLSRSSGYVECRVNSGSNTNAIAVDGTTSYIGNYSNIPLSFTTNSLERLRITAAGLVGIGTSAPAERLHVAGVGQKILVAPVNYDLSQDSAYLIAGTTSYTGATTNWGTYGFQHRFKSTAGGIPRVTIDANSGELFCVTGEGRVGIGTTSPDRALVVETSSGDAEIAINAQAGGSQSSILRFRVGGTTNALIQATSTTLLFYSGTTERARIDSSGRLLVGTSSARTNYGNSTLSAQLQVEGTGFSNSAISTTRNSNDAFGAAVVLNKSRGTAVGSNTLPSDGDEIGGLHFQASDGTEFVPAARIDAFVDGTPGANDMPGRLVFSVTIDGQASPSEAMRITNSRRVYIGTTTGVIDTSNFGTVIYNNGYFNAGGNFNGTQELARWYGNAGSVRFMGDGDVENTNNSYGALSDIKLKENVTDADSQWDDIKALQVRKYNLKAETGYSTHTQIGLVAQEVELVSPGLVGASPDRDAEGNDLGTVTKSVNYSVLYMKAVKALQEAMERIEILEAKVAALESA